MQCTLCVKTYGHLNVWSMTLSALCHQYKYCVSNELPSNLAVLPVQTDDKWLFTTYTSVPECGGKELHQKAHIAMTGFTWYGKQAATFTTNPQL